LIAPPTLKASEAPQPLAPRQRNEILLFLLARSEQVERHRAERHVRCHRNGRRSIGPRELHNRERVAHRVGARSAIFFRKGQPHEAEARHFTHEIVRKRFLAVHLFGARRNPFAREFPDGPPDSLLFCG